MIEELRHRIGNLANNSPTLLLGEAASIFKKNYTKEVIKLNTEEDCVNFVDNGNNMFLVFDISFFLREAPFISLFFRSLKTPSIILSSDNMVDVSAYIYFKNIVKYSTPAKSNLSDSVTAQKIWKEEPDKSNIQKFYATESPELYYFKKKYSMGKYVDLLSTNVS